MLEVEVWLNVRNVEARGETSDALDTVATTRKICVNRALYYVPIKVGKG
jgi:hypothetical protein